MTEREWPEGPEQPRAHEQEVHVWCADGASTVPNVSRHFDAGERARVGRFVQAADAERFVAAHGLVRLVLARYLGIPPSALEFATNDNGKPFLAAPDGVQHLRFNLSHSLDLTLLAVARGREIGVDVEQIRADVSCESLARRFFSSRENAALECLPAAKRREAFFACWTRKEAYLKARGVGIAGGLDGFDVSVRPDEPAALLAIGGDPQASEPWSLVDLPVAAQYRAALAVEGHPFDLRRWRFVPLTHEL